MSTVAGPGVAHTHTISDIHTHTHTPSIHNNAKLRVLSISHDFTLISHIAKHTHAPSHTETNRSLILPACKIGDGRGAAPKKGQAGGGAGVWPALRKVCATVLLCVRVRPCECVCVCPRHLLECVWHARSKIDALARDYRKPSETRSVQATFSSDSYVFTPLHASAASPTCGLCVYPDILPRVPDPCSRRLLCALTHSFTAALLTSGASAYPLLVDRAVYLFPLSECGFLSTRWVCVLCADAALLSQYSREMDTAPCSALGLSLLPPSPCVTLGGLCVCDPLSVPTPFRPSALTPSEDAAPTLPPPALVHTVTLRDRHVPALFPPAVPTASSKEAKPKPVKVKPPA